MFARLAIFAALLLNVSVTAGPWSGGARDDRPGHGTTSVTCPLNNDAQSIDRIEPLRFAATGTSCCAPPPPNAGARLHPTSDAITPSVRCDVHTSGCPPPQA